MHQQSLYYGDMKPSNLLVFRDQKVKIGDFGISLLMNSDEDSYYLKGLTHGYCIEEINVKFDKCEPVSREMLI